MTVKQTQLKKTLLDQHEFHHRKAQEILKVKLSKRNLQEAQDVCILDRFTVSNEKSAIHLFS